MSDTQTVKTQKDFARREESGKEEKQEERQKEKQEEKNPGKKKNPIRWITINKKYFSVCCYTLFVIIAAIVAYMMISNWKSTFAVIGDLFRTLSSFFLGILIAYFLFPLVTQVDRLLQKWLAKGKGKKITFILSILVSYLLVIGFIIAAFVFVVPQIADSIQEITNKLPAMYRQFTKELTVFEEKHPEFDMQAINEQIADMVPNLVEYGTKMVGNLIPMVYSVSISIIRTVFNVILGIVISIYMIYSKDSFTYQVKRIIYAIFPEEKGNNICTTFRECNDIFGSFLISKAIDSLIIGCICCVIMNILNLPYAVLLSVVVGITNMIPYFGPFIGAVPGVLIYLCIDWEQAFFFIIIILIIQQFDGWILGPRLLGQSTGLSPLWVIFAITVGGAYFGVLGMFIGVPVVAVIAFLLNKFINSRLCGKKIGELEKTKK